MSVTITAAYLVYQSARICLEGELVGEEAGCVKLAASLDQEALSIKSCNGLKPADGRSS